MAKTKKYFVCASCGAEFSKWQGKCPSCNEWNTIIEDNSKKVKRSAKTAEAVSLSSIGVGTLTRINTDINEFNLVCGGGIVPGSVILIGGEPGIGKSTLALQIAGYFRTLYISGEETPEQIRRRAQRLGAKIESIKMSTATDVEQIIALSRKEKPECLIIDSIQTVYSAEIPGVRGSVSQIRESASQLADYAKAENITVFLIGHITKEGSIAGPKVLEHLVDTVLYFEGNSTRDIRMLKAFKNRYGSLNEVGLFRMTAKGLVEVKDKNKVFFSPFVSSSPGNAVSAALEGSRTLLFEVQALVTFSSYPNPRRMADGLDLNRLIIIIAVLEKFTGLKLNTFDIFINVSGGFQITETSSDLAVAMAIVSSYKNQAIPEGVGFLGEISLSGEVRPVPQCARRVPEFKHVGFNALMLSQANVKDAEASGFEKNIIGVSNIEEAVEKIF